MEKEPKIIGKNLTPEQAEEIGGVVREYAGKGKERLEGELEKTPEEIKMIGKLDSCLSEELEGLGLGKKPPVAAEQIHFLDEETFRKNFPEIDAAGVSDNIKKAAYVDKSSRTEKIALYKTVLHEIIHLSAFRKFRFDAGKGKMGLYRTGYRVHPSEHQGEGRHGHLKGVDEAIVDRFTFEILKKHYGDIRRELDLPAGQTPLLHVYRSYMDVLDKVIEGVASRRGESREETWKRFKKGLFTGEMMHLRDIEEAFGKGALRVVGAMGSGTREDFSQKEINENIVRYLEIEDDGERNRLAADILNKRERYHYLKQKGFFRGKKAA